MSDEELLALFRIKHETPIFEDRMAGLRAVAAAAWDEGKLSGLAQSFMGDTSLNPYIDHVEPEADPDICPECGLHRLTQGDYSMSHKTWLDFNRWMERRPLSVSTRLPISDTKSQKTAETERASTEEP